MGKVAILTHRFLDPSSPTSPMSAAEERKQWNENDGKHRSLAHSECDH